MDPQDPTNVVTQAPQAKPCKPYVKTTQDEMEERVSLVLDWLLEGKTKGEIVQAGKENWGCGTRTIETYLSRARRLSAQLISDKPKEEWRKEQLERYMAIATNPEARDIDKIKAMERIDKIFGLEQHAPSQVQVTGKDGGAIQSAVTVVTVDLTSKLSEYAGAIRSAALANLREQLVITDQSKPAKPGD